MKKNILKTYYSLQIFIVSFFSSYTLTYAAPINNVNLLTSAPPATPKDFSSFVCIFIKLALDFIPFLVIIAVGAFLQGLIKYVGHGDNEEKRSEGRKMMIYGIVGFFFMVGFWGMIKMFVAGFGADFVIPQFKSGGVGFTC